MIKMFLIASGIILVMFFLLALFSMTKAASEFDRQMEWLNGEIPFREGERSNEKKTKKNRIGEAERKQRQFDRELKDCMHCKFFWGNNHRCAINKCCKENRNNGEKKTIPEKCVGCPYKQSNDYCFPCMKDILSRK